MVWKSPAMLFISVSSSMTASRGDGVTVWGGARSVTDWHSSASHCLLGGVPTTCLSLLTVELQYSSLHPGSTDLTTSLLLSPYNEWKRTAAQFVVNRSEDTLERHLNAIFISYLVSEMHLKSQQELSNRILDYNKEKFFTLTWSGGNENWQLWTHISKIRESSPDLTIPSEPPSNICICELGVSSSIRRK